MRARPGRWRGGAPADEYAYVSCMCVKDEFRRRGVADALLRAAEKVALAWGYDCAALHVFHALTVEDKHKESFVAAGVVDEACKILVAESVCRQVLQTSENHRKQAQEVS